MEDLAVNAESKISIAYGRLSDARENVSILRKRISEIVADMTGGEPTGPMESKEKEVQAGKINLIRTTADEISAMVCTMNGLLDRL